MAITANSILKHKTVITKFFVEPLDDHIYAKEFSFADRRKIMELAAEDASLAMAANIVVGLVDKNGDRIFADDQLGEVTELNETMFASLFLGVNSVNAIDGKEVAKN